MIVHGVDLIDAGDMVINHLHQEGEFEPVSVATWCAAVTPGRTMVDVGAYTGLYAIAAAQRGANAVALEPNPPAYKRLQSNAARNDVVLRSLCVAAGSKAAESQLKLRSPVPLTSSGSLRGIGGRPVPVKVVQLDELLEGDDVAAMKIDVEGYELEVIRGAVKTIARCCPLLITEALSQVAVDFQTKLLSTFGYQAPQAVDGHNLIWSVR